MSVIKKLWSENWIQVKNTLAQHLKQHYYISFQCYIQICQKQGVKEIEHQEQLLQLLHDLGAIIYFKKFNVSETPILEPNWLLNSLYKIICSPQLSENKGVLFLKDLMIILKPNNDNDYRYTVEHYRDLINLMRKIELCFLVDKASILVPQLLESEEPAIEFNPHKALRFRIHYSYLNEAIMPRLIVALREDVNDKKYWRTGILLKNNTLKSDALIKVNYVENLITIYVKGEKKREYFSIIRKALSDIEAK